MSKLYLGRRKIIWERLVSFKSWLVLLLVTALGAGLLPLAPGTMGTLVGLPLAYWTAHTSFWVRTCFWVLLTCVGSWAAAQFDQMMETQDNQNIVIDEVIGMGIAAWTVGDDLRLWLLSFCLFRFFDVVKIPPVRQIDQWSKKKTNPMWSGFGVIADDIVAGFQALGVILILQKLNIF